MPKTNHNATASLEVGSRAHLLQYQPASWLRRQDCSLQQGHAPDFKEQVMLMFSEIDNTVNNYPSIEKLKIALWYFTGTACFIYDHVSFILKRFT